MSNYFSNIKIFFVVPYINRHYLKLLSEYPNDHEVTNTLTMNGKEYYFDDNTGQVSNTFNDVYRDLSSDEVTMVSQECDPDQSILYNYLKDTYGNLIPKNIDFIDGIQMVAHLNYIATINMQFSPIKFVEQLNDIPNVDLVVDLDKLNVCIRNSIFNADHNARFTIQQIGPKVIVSDSKTNVDMTLEGRYPNVFTIVNNTDSVFNLGFRILHFLTDLTEFVSHKAEVKPETIKGDVSATTLLETLEAKLSLDENTITGLTMLRGFTYTNIDVAIGTDVIRGYLRNGGDEWIFFSDRNSIIIPDIEIRSSIDSFTRQVDATIETRLEKEFRNKFIKCK